MPVTVADSVGPRHRRLSRLESGAGEPRVGCERDQPARQGPSPGGLWPAAPGRDARLSASEARVDPSTIFVSDLQCLASGPRLQPSLDLPPPTFGRSPPPAMIAQHHHDRCLSLPCRVPPGSPVRGISPSQARLHFRLCLNSRFWAPAHWHSGAATCRTRICHGGPARSGCTKPTDGPSARAG